MVWATSRKDSQVSTTAAITIRRSQEEIVRAWDSGDSAPFGDAEVTYAPAPGERGTEVRVTIDQTVRGGKLGGVIAAAVGSDPKRKLEDALRRFKQLLETGQVVRSDGTPEGTDAKQLRNQDAAQPVSN
jgi:uncharacterized membrane protein